MVHYLVSYPIEIMSQCNPDLRFCLRVMDLNTKLRKILYVENSTHYDH
jgi:hypothetical protein